jgi:hypothetical protein
MYIAFENKKFQTALYILLYEKKDFSSPFKIRRGENQLAA